MYGFRGIAYPGFSNALVHSFIAKSVPQSEMVEVRLVLHETGDFVATLDGVVQGKDFEVQDLIRAFSCGCDTDFDLYCSVNRGRIKTLFFNGERITV